MTTAELLTAALAGLGLGLGLIVAIGAQNAFVLRQGIRREKVLTVVLICIASDAALILAGVAGAGAVFTAAPWLAIAARWGGGLFLLGYALLAARRALRRPTADEAALSLDSGSGEERTWSGEVVMSHGSDSPTWATAVAKPGSSTLAVETPTATVLAAPQRRPLLAVVGTALALTWLNPHVYLDTFVLLGSVGSSHGPARWAFAAGAILGSALWFSALGLAARALAPVFARPVAWRVLDGVIAMVMTCVATGLLLGS